MDQPIHRLYFCPEHIVRTGEFRILIIVYGRCEWEVFTVVTRKKLMIHIRMSLLHVLNKIIIPIKEFIDFIISRKKYYLIPILLLLLLFGAIIIINANFFFDPFRFLLINVGSLENLLRAPPNPQNFGEADNFFPHLRQNINHLFLALLFCLVFLADFKGFFSSLLSFPFTIGV